MASLREIKALSLVLMSLSLLAFPASSAPAGGGVDITAPEFGAVPDGKKDSTQALIKAWNAACKTGPPKLIIPAGNFLCGEVVFAGPCTAPVTIELTGTLIGSSDLSQYSAGIWIQVTGVDGITMTGTGTLDGRGPDVWKFAAKNGGDSMLPNSLQFSKVKNGVMENFNVVNSKGFHTKVTDSSDIQVRNMHITAPGDSPNTDGLHISSTTNINITGMTVGTGDDCFSVGEGSVNVNILDSKCGPGHGISIGSLGKRANEKDVSNVLVKNCTIQGTTNGARIKTFHASPVLSASGIVFEDITMVDVKNPIIIDQHYSSRNIAGDSKVAISDVHFRNIKGTTISENAVILNCSKAVPCKGVELVNINLTPSATLKAPLTSVCDNVQPAITTMATVDSSACGGGAATAKPEPAAGAADPAKPDPAAGEKADPKAGGAKEDPKAGGAKGDPKAGKGKKPEKPDASTQPEDL